MHDLQCPISFSNIDNPIDFETFLARILSEKAPIIALGSPGEIVGAGRIHVEETEWREKFAWLAENAELIFIIPGAREGILWEIEWIKLNRLLDKCIFVCPPETKNKTLASLWSESANKLREYGISLPAHNEKGKFIKLNNDGMIESTVSLEKLLSGRPKNNREIIESLVKQ